MPTNDTAAITDVDTWEAYESRPVQSLCKEASMSQSASEHAVHFVTPPLRSGRPYENPALPELPNLWSLDHPDTAPIPDEAACPCPMDALRHVFPYRTAQRMRGRHGRGAGPGGPWKQARPDIQSLWPCPSRRGCCTTSPSPIPCSSAAAMPRSARHGWSIPLATTRSPSRLPPCRMALAVARRSRTSGFFRHLCGQAGRHDEMVSLDERYEDLLVRYGKSEHSRAAIHRGWEHSKTIERVLSAQLEFPLHESTVVGGRLVSRA